MAVLDLEAMAHAVETVDEAVELIVAAALEPAADFQMEYLFLLPLRRSGNHHRRA